MSVQIGVENLNIAVMTEEDTADAQAVYGANQSVAKTISLNFQPQSSIAVLDADDGPAETAVAHGPINIALNTKDLPLAIRAALLGSTYDAVTGGMIHKQTDNPPYVAMSFKSLMANGNYRFVQLYKGKATQPQENYQTKGAAINFNTPTINLQFIRREYDEIDYGMWDEPTFGDAATFFDAVYENVPDTAAPTVTVAPVDGATEVAVSANVVWTFNEAIQEAGVTGANFMVTEDDGTPVAGALSINAAKTIVTFDPTENLGASTTYIAIATTNIKDVAGNALAANSITDFTTAA